MLLKQFYIENTSIGDLVVSYPVPVHWFALLFDLFLVSLDLPPDCIQEILRAGFLSQPVEAVTTINLKAILWNLLCLRSIMLTAAPDCFLTRVQFACGQACKFGVREGHGCCGLRSQSQDAHQCDDASSFHFAVFIMFDFLIATTDSWLEGSSLFTLGPCRDLSSCSPGPTRWIGVIVHFWIVLQNSRFLQEASRSPLIGL